MSDAARAAVVCSCGIGTAEPLASHGLTCAMVVTLNARLAREYAEIQRYLADKAAGRRRWRGPVAAIRWWANTRAAKAVARGLPIDPDREGSGRPNRGADSPVHMQWAAVTYAVKLAEEDDRREHPARPAPIARWLVDHVGYGRAYAWIAEEAGVWGEAEVQRRVERAIREVGKRLRARGMFQGRAEDDADA